MKRSRENSKSEDDKLSDEVQENMDLEELIRDDDESYEPRMPKDNAHEDLDLPEPYVETMSEHLLSQLQLLNLSEIDYKIGEYIIYNLRDDGYLDADISVEDMSHMFELPEAQVTKVLKKVQRLDPVGIASRNLRECLLVQLESQGEDENSIALLIIRDAYDEFANRRFEKVAESLDITLDEIKDAITEITRLNPKPGEGLTTGKQDYIVPDFYVSVVDDELVVSQNDFKTPGLRISNHYKKMIRQSKKLNKETREFLKSKVSSAKWFINAIQQRQRTMQRTMEAIVEKQEDFFRKGPEFIKPLIMKDVAEVIEMDIATVSRVCKDKYVETDYGIFPLKHFFNEGMETQNGEEISTIRIKEKLKTIIENEPPNKPYSDEELSKMLKDDGIPIARRTVAKYREQLDIPIKRLRKTHLVNYPFVFLRKSPHFRKTKCLLTHGSNRILTPFKYKKMNMDNQFPKFQATTILGVIKDGEAALAGDGQVTLGNTVMKHQGNKVRRLYHGQILAGFAGASADAFALFERFEAKLESYNGNLTRSAVELAKDWRTDRVLRRLEALLAVVNSQTALVISGTGDVIEPDDNVLAIGSGGPYALAAARALTQHSKLSASEIVQQAMAITADICIYTNHQISLETITQNKK